MRYYLIAGEPSGDLHGANLMKGLKAHDPEAKFHFWGGDKMAGVGGSGNLAKHYKETSFFGIVEVIKNLRTIRRQMKECRQDVEAFAPDVLILVDYPGFNMKMARWAKEHGIRVFYYIAPKVWAWREWRVKAIRKYVDELFIIFPFERDYFPKHGIRPIFEGNPLVDAIEARRASLPSPDEFRRRHALDERPIVALLAGSRRSEIKANLPLMVDLARKFPDRQFVVTGVSWLDRSIYEQYIADSGIRYVCDQTYETLAAAEAAVVTSGTATLETALLNVPEVVVYRTLWFQVKLQPYVLKVPYVSLVNLNLGRESVVEIIQSDLDITRAERELRAILTGGEKRERMLRDFAELQAVIGAPGASEDARTVHDIPDATPRRRVVGPARHFGSVFPEPDRRLQHDVRRAEEKRGCQRIIAFHVLEPGGDRHRLDRIGYAGRKSGRRKMGFGGGFSLAARRMCFPLGQSAKIRPQQINRAHRTDRTYSNLPFEENKKGRKTPYLQPFLILGVQVLTRRDEDRTGHTLCISHSG